MRKIIPLALAAFCFYGMMSLNASAQAPQTFAPTLFGADERETVPDTTVYPYSAVCKLLIHYQNGSTGEGTGFIYGDNTLATAAHVLYDTRLGRGGAVKGLTVIPGKNGEQEPFGRITLDNTNATFYVPDGWKNTLSWELDYGAVRISDTWPSAILPLELGNADDYPAALLDGRLLSIAGYDDKGIEQRFSSGLVQAVRPFDLLYQIGILPGQSGAPVLTQDGTVVAIQNYGVNVGARAWEMRYNSGARLTRQVYDFLRAREKE